MENRVIQDRLAALRDGMRKKGIDYYMMPTADFHGSEYVNDYFKVREFFCNFTGSNGTLLVWQEGAGLWTDGRYFIQAERELWGTGVKLFRMYDEGVPDLDVFLADEMRDGQTLGFDGRVVSAAAGKNYEKKFEAKGKQIKIVCGEDLADAIWTERPDFPAGGITVLDEDIAGRSVEEKLGDVRGKLREEGAENLLLTKLDDLMWLFNIRGCDVECNPVAMSYAYITQEQATLFVQQKVLDKGVREYLERNDILVEEYDNIVTYLEGLPEGSRILFDQRWCSYILYRTLCGKHTLIEKHNPTELLKAVKNPVEISNMKKIYLKDSIALTKFIYWLKTNIREGKITEITAAEKLEEFRREIPEFLGLSFPTIAGYGPNAAMMHYEATPEKHAVLKPKGLFLVDSGGQYRGGTTDVTRTIALGEISDEQKLHYTKVLEAMLRMTHARWLHGCTGRNLDILARQPMWDMDMDYKCGTGHGVGYMLNVHEGPQNLSWHYRESLKEAVLEEGMDVTNEPGIYIEGSHGIRIENVMLVQKGVKNEYGQFMHFETLTWVPVDLRAVDETILTEQEAKWLREYQREVFDRLSPYLSEEENRWLWKETRGVKFIFEDLDRMDDLCIQRVLQEVDRESLAAALKGAGEHLQEVILRNVSRRLQTMVREDMELMAHVRPACVEEAQDKIAKIITRLEAEGVIVVE